MFALRIFAALGFAVGPGRKATNIPFVTVSALLVTSVPSM